MGLNHDFEYLVEHGTSYKCTIGLGSLKESVGTSLMLWLTVTHSQRFSVNTMSTAQVPMAQQTHWQTIA